MNCVKRAVAIVAAVLVVIACIPLIPIIALVGFLTPEDEDERGYFEW